MSISRKHLEQASNGVLVRPVAPRSQALALLARRYCLEVFNGAPWGLDSSIAAFAAGTDTNKVILHTGFNQFEFYYVGGASDGFMPVLGSEGGYDWHLDHDTVGEGVNINFGGTVAGHPRTFRPASENFFARLLLNCADASGLNALFGFQDAGAIPAGFTDWTDLVGIRILGDDSSTTAVVQAESNLGNSGSTAPSTQALGVTLEEPTEIELELRVVNKSAQFWVNGVQKASGTLTVAFSGTPTLTPSAAFLQSTDTTARIITRAFECGLLEDRYEGSLRSLLTAIGVPAGT